MWLYLGENDHTDHGPGRTTVGAQPTEAMVGMGMVVVVALPFFLLSSLWDLAGGNAAKPCARVTNGTY